MATSSIPSPSAPVSPLHSPARVRAALLALALGGFAIGTTEFASMGVLPDIASGLGESIPTTGAIISAYALGVVVGAPMFAILGAHLPRKSLLLFLMAAFTAANAFSAAASSFPLLIVARFASGLPHGAYFGIAAVVAASFVTPERRARAIATVMTGLTVATVAGVPLSTFLGQQLGWRSTYWTVAVLAALTVASVAFVVPSVPRTQDVGVGAELHSLRRPQVWISLGVVAIGFGGVFAVYSFVTPIMTGVAGLSASSVPIVLALFGLGMTLGNLAGGRLADRNVDRSIAIGLTMLFLVLLTFPFTAPHPVTAGAAIFLLGLGGSSTLPGVATRLLDAAGPAKSLASALMHSAFNVANAVGAWVGGAVIAAGWGYTAPSTFGALFALGGLAMLGIGVLTARREASSPQLRPETAPEPAHV